MAQFQNDELEYVVDDYFDIADFEDTDAFAGNQLRGSHGADSDFLQSKAKTDTSATEFPVTESCPAMSLVQGKFVKGRWDKEDCISYWQRYKASLSRLY